METTSDPELHLHFERVAWEDGRLIGRCRCGLVREYDPEGIAEPVVIEQGDMVNKGVKYEDLPPETKDKVDQELQKHPVPPKPKGAQEVYRYYEENKEAILRDLEVLGEEATRQRWGISWATWKCRRGDKWSGIAARWGLLDENGKSKFEKAKRKKGKKAKKAKKVKAKPVAKAPPDGLPPMPSWNDNWPAEVQVKWLDVWLKLSEVRHGRVGD